MTIFSDLRGLATRFINTALPSFRSSLRFPTSLPGRVEIVRRPEGLIPTVDDYLYSAEPIPPHVAAYTNNPKLNVELLVPHRVDFQEAPEMIVEESVVWTTADLDNATNMVVFDMDNELEFAHATEPEVEASAPSTPVTPVRVRPSNPVPPSEASVPTTPVAADATTAAEPSAKIKTKKLDPIIENAKLAHRLASLAFLEGKNVKKNKQLLEIAGKNVDVFNDDLTLNKNTSGLKRQPAIRRPRPHLLVFDDTASVSAATDGHSEFDNDDDDIIVANNKVSLFRVKAKRRPNGPARLGYGTTATDSVPGFADHDAEIVEDNTILAHKVNRSRMNAKCRPKTPPGLRCDTTAISAAKTSADFVPAPAPGLWLAGGDLPKATTKFVPPPAPGQWLAGGDLPKATTKLVPPPAPGQWLAGGDLPKATTKLVPPPAPGQWLAGGDLPKASTNFVPAIARKGRLNIQSGHWLAGRGLPNYDDNVVLTKSPAGLTRQPARCHVMGPRRAVGTVK